MQLKCCTKLAKRRRKSTLTSNTLVVWLSSDARQVAILPCFQALVGKHLLSVLSPHGLAR